MSLQLILLFFPEELRGLLLDPSISDLMINGSTGVYADRDGVVQHISLSTPYTNERLTAAIERVARILGQDLSSQNSILNTRLPDGSRVAVVGAPSSINGPTLTIRKFNRWYTSDELIASGSLPTDVRDTVVSLMLGASSAMLISLLVAFSVTPWAALKFLRGRAASQHSPTEGRVTALYRRVMASLLEDRRHALVFAAVVVVLLLAAVALVPLNAVKVKDASLRQQERVSGHPQHA